MRPGEAVRLADVDPDEAMITIRDAKYGKSRRIPVDATVTAAPGIPGKAPVAAPGAEGAGAVPVRLRDPDRHPPSQRRVPPDHRGDRDRSERREPAENSSPTPTGNQFAPNSGAGLRDLMARMGHNRERAAMIYQHEARGADQAITSAIDAHVEDEKRRGGDDEDGAAGALVPVG